jgi:hypothetical protein
MAAPRNNPKAFSEWYEQDYFRRRRRPWLLTAVILGTIAVSAVALAATLLSQHGRRAFQAGPLSDPHASLANNCEACHTEPFATARRFLPSNSNVRSTSDAACLTCHAAGTHAEHQVRFTGANGQAANCAECHREHRGGQSIANLSDDHCIACHADTQTTDGEHRFAHKITAFDSDHPEFGAWRGGPLSDPGTLKFNHKAHLDLASKLDVTKDGRNAWMSDAPQRLHDLSCTFCHEPDDERKYIRPVRYDAHCAACHPLTVPIGDPPTRLHHPQRGQTTEVVRAELLERFWKKIAAEQKAAPAPAAAAADRPPVLNRGLPPLPADQKALVQKLSRDAEDRLFDPAGGDVLAGVERSQFSLRSGCAYCHEESTTPNNRPDGLPIYKLPGLRGRWDNVMFPHERFGNKESRSTAAQSARDRWFPYSRFSHESHRMLNCTGCHKMTAESTATSDVLMPTIDVCKQCHNRSTVGVRSDCLECHRYHDRSAEPTGLHGRMSVEQAQDMTRPGGIAPASKP